MNEKYILTVGEGEAKKTYLIERIFLIGEQCFFSVVNIDTFSVMFGEYLGERTEDQEENRERVYQDFLDGCKNITFVDGYMEDMLYELWENG